MLPPPGTLVHTQKPLIVLVQILLKPLFTVDLFALSPFLKKQSFQEDQRKWRGESTSAAAIAALYLLLMD